MDFTRILLRKVAPQNKRRKKTQMEINADILINVPWCFCSFDFQGPMNIKTLPSLLKLEWTHGRQQTKQERLKKTKLFGLKVTSIQNKSGVCCSLKTNKKRTRMQITAEENPGFVRHFHWFWCVTTCEFIELLFFEQTLRSHSADRVSSTSIHWGERQSHSK